MSYLRKKNTISKFFFSKFFLFIFFIATILAIYSAISMVPKFSETVKNKNLAVDRIGELKAKEVSLTAQLVNMQSVEGVEESIREKFGSAKEGEGLIIITDEKDSPRPEIIIKNGFWSSLTRFFGF